MLIEIAAGDSDYARTGEATIPIARTSRTTQRARSPPPITELDEGDRGAEAPQDGAPRPGPAYTGPIDSRTARSERPPRGEVSSEIPDVEREQSRRSRRPRTGTRRREEDESTLAPQPDSGPGGLDDEARRERAAELERQMQDAAQIAQDNEEHREQQFRDNEIERERQFLDNERRRADEAAGRFPGDGQGPSMVQLTPDQMEAVRGAVAEALRDPEVLEGTRRERETAEQEHKRLRDEVAAEHLRMVEDRDATIAELRKELARAREELDNERSARLTEESEVREQQRMENQERDESFRNQLMDITNIAQDNRDCCMENKEFMKQQYEEKIARRDAKDGQAAQSFELVQQIHANQATNELARQEAERLANETKAGMFLHLHTKFACSL